MMRLGMNLWFTGALALSALSAVAQSQSCPINNNFSEGTLHHWEAYTGNNKQGNGSGAVMEVYDSVQSYPNGTRDANGFPEFNLGGRSGIQVITSQFTDAFGGFQSIPTINGYAYHYSVLLGSTAVSNHAAPDPVNGQPNPQATTPQGGYVRGIRYLITVPAGPTTLPFTMTYAYAMVLENGAHASSEQPMARAIVSTPGGIIDCASPTYFLPTNGGLDSATARNNGFAPSGTPSPNAAPNGPGSQGSDTHLRDVWTKGWTEVTFDLSAYRGQQVTLTFEADNCVPGGHFAYAYFAMRDICAGLQISGDSLACSNSIAKYYIPSLDNATYDWSVPDGWTSGGDANNNTITVKVGPQSGWIVAHASNSCTRLTDSLFVHLYKGAIPESSIDPRDTTICFGETAPLYAVVTTGTAYNWVSTEPLPRGQNGLIASLPFTVGLTATPTTTHDYILNILNDGCPITVSDTFHVTVVPPFRVNAGSDTLVVVGEPLQFLAISSDLYPDLYEWSPSTDLNDPDTAAPVGLYGAEIKNITYQVKATDQFGCTGTGSVKVTIAPTFPDIFMPNAFTPAGTSNNVFRPVCIGVASLDYFRVYNRWGQLLYSTSQMGKGWDGRIQGKMQESNAYLWMVRGTDYTGKIVSKQGTVMLIR
jgi:gliding motility-associated-like protein